MPQIVNTWKCNFKCEHCLWSCSPTRKGMVSRSDIIEFVREIAKYNDEFINLLGGETFMHPDIVWQVEYLTGVFGSVRIVTNGTMLFKPIGEDFLEHFMGNDKLYIMVSDDPFHKRYWPKGFTAQKAKWLIESYDIRTEEDNRCNMREPYQYIGRAKKNNIGDPDMDNVTCWDDDIRIDPCLLPNGDISACCQGKCIVGRAGYHSYEYMEEKFQHHMRGKVRSKLKCYKCVSRIKTN